jgi:TonB family protein
MEYLSRSIWSLGLACLVALPACVTAPSRLPNFSPDNLSVLDYPPTSVRIGETGRVLIEFSLNEHGRLKNFKIINSSGKSRLDEASVFLLSRGSFALTDPVLRQPSAVFDATVMYCLGSTDCEQIYPNSIPINVSHERFRPPPPQAVRIYEDLGFSGRK